MNAVRKSKKPKLIACFSIVLLLATLAIWLIQEVEYARIVSADGNYTAVVSYRRYETFRPTLPGQSGDKPGFIHMLDKNGEDYGRAEVPMLWMSHDLIWKPDGAELALVCEWNFPTRELRMWNEN